MSVSQLLTETLSAPPLKAGAIAHKRTPGGNPAERGYNGTPTAAIPPCGAIGGSWSQLSLGRAVELGLVPCTADACFGESSWPQ